MGRITQHEILKASSRDQFTAIEDSLYRWTKSLPEQLRLSSDNANGHMYTNRSLRSYTLENRQLNILYLTTIILFYRSKTLEGPFPTAAVIAASTIAGVFEDFLARDEVRFLGPCFTFHLLAASIALLSCYKYPELWALAQQDLEILKQAQQNMTKSWPSALGSIGSFDRMFKLTVTTQKKVAGLPENSLTSYQAVFFEDCEMSLCRVYALLVRKPQVDDAREHSGTSLVNATKSSQQILRMPGDLGQETSMLPPPSHHQTDLTSRRPHPEQPLVPEQAMVFDHMFHEEAGQMDGAIGDWLFWDQLAFDTN